jgi:blocked-early-in-transport protein 1
MASQSALRQYRMIVYVVGALVVLWLLSKVFRGYGGGSPHKAPVGEVEYYVHL